MLYQSTRGYYEKKTFEDTLFSGFTASGDLYLPEKIPKVDATILEQWRQLSLENLVVEILKLFISDDEIKHHELTEVIEGAFHKFTNTEVLPIKHLHNGLNIAEMFHGQTLAFKDFSFAILSKLVKCFLKKRQRNAISLISTTGDTGSAALEAFKDVEGIDVIVLIPKNYISRVQELFMTTVIAQNCLVIKAEGISDDLNDILKYFMKNDNRPANAEIVSFNSINWGRMVGQICLYFWYYLRMSDNSSEVVNFVVPTGAGGSITAGSISALMGLPIKLVSTVNDNDIFYDIIQNGVLCPRNKMISTLACAMDNKMPYNVERLLYLYSNFDGNYVRDVMNRADKNESTTLDKDMVLHMQSILSCRPKVGCKEIKETMKRCFSENQYLICPHTATAVYYHYKEKNDDGKIIYLATASPDKFEEVVEEASLPKSGSKLIENLHNKPEKFVDMKHKSNWLPFLKKTLDEIDIRSGLKMYSDI